MKRLGIFFFYEKNGDVDDFITYYLRDLARNLTELIVVCNGKLSRAAQHLKNLPIKLLCAKTRAWMCGPIKPRWIITAGSV